MAEESSEEAQPYLFQCGTPPGPGETVWQGDVQYVVGADGRTLMPVATSRSARPSLRDRLADRVFCTACLRLRFSPGHLLICQTSRIRSTPDKRADQ